MNKEEMRSYIEYMGNSELVKLCNDIYEYKYVTGKLRPNCTLNQLAENIQYWEIRDIEEAIIEVATKKLNNVVLLLFKSEPTNFLK